MYGMEFLITVAAFILAIVALNKNSRLETRIAQLKLQLGNLADELAQLRKGGIAAEVQEPIPEAPVAAAVETAPPPAEAVEEVPAEPEEPAPAEVASPKRDVERALAQRWFVWIGGAAIAIGGLLFVKYAYDNQLISPSLQIILGLLLGAVLVASGEYVRRQPTTLTGGDYVPAALSAAGLVTAFGSIYAAYALYELISPLLAFGGLAIVGIGAIFLSRLQGPLIAALGLIGSYGTPALIPSEHPSAWGFFPYILIIVAACFAVLRGRNWWWLAYAAIAGAAAWAMLWMWGGPFSPSDSLPLGLFALALGLIAFFALLGPAMLREGGETLTQPSTISPPLAIGLAGLGAQAIMLMALVHKSHHGSVALALFFVAMALNVLFAWRKSGLAPLVAIAALLSFLVLMVWDEVAIHELAMDDRGFWTTVLGTEAKRFLSYMLISGAAFALIGCVGSRVKHSPASWGVAGGASAALFVTGAWARVSELIGDNTWALIALCFAAVLLATAWLSRPRHDQTEPNLSSGFLSIGAALVLLFLLDRLFDNIWLTLAISALALAFAGVAAPMQVKLQGPIAAALASLVTLRLFLSRELWNEDRTLPLGGHWPLYGYGVPAAVFLIASRLLRTAGHLRSAMTMEGLSLGLIISLIALELRELIAGNIVYEEPHFLEMAAHILTWLGAGYGLMYRQRLFSSFIATWGARILIVVACAAIVLASLGVLNPVVTEEPVPGNAVFNALLLAYLAPVVLIGLIARKLEVLNWEKLRPIAGALALVLAFTYVTLETKRVFQGHIMVSWSLSVAESYAYSAVWLGFALALFVAGIRLARQYIRYAGLGVMVLVVLKVFLWDMSSLEGLYRIASFIGLGLCLVGIGWLYQKFVLKLKEA